MVFFFYGLKVVLILRLINQIRTQMFEHIYLDGITNSLMDLGPKVIMAVVVLYFGFRIIEWAVKFTTTVQYTSQKHPQYQP